MENLRGIVMMIVSMAGFAMEDMFVKLASAGMPTGQILLFLGLFGAPLFWALARREGKAVLSREVLAGPILWRNLGEMVGTAGFVTALALTPLSSASAILQATPLVVTFGAAVFLGEKVGWRRWSAIAVGFAGVVVVIRPGLEGFELASLWAVLGVIGLAGRDLATRRVAASTSTMQVGAWAFLTVAAVGGMMLAVGGGAVWPGPGQMGLLLGALCFGFVGYWTLILATRVGEVSAIVPFRYTRLVFAMLIGFLVFHERPDAWMLAGAALIIGSGLYSFTREQRLRRLSLRQAAE
ncbi:DMT family transporter [Cereibacter azotoformans]|uniref:Drug/metabolite transporter (DMT)-like permease n=2 Tax=Cereibacter TaxID=1653176 RepID=A0A2T5JWU3_9RHOB|nr:DMT family transporter [Cereibacter azotoformans]AXQ93042.1 DMT family transporter [Cereibacter sphaeroides]MBO4169265.1 DMT family transporter [Cereibacter azotoformans]PTR14635.1 drug/metabolite transporter (DMT)-like permease [Cereibacter azotoformans]UIJ31346.1 DMT family transporter [Cereibacter azotoformans]ULB09164.1 DMT family transporter [Cereibacter azotoformans]